MPDGAGFRASQSKRGVPDQMQDRLIVALDNRTVESAFETVQKLDGVVSFFKVGLQLLFAEGVDKLISHLRSSYGKLFLDAKMYDVPETVEQAVRFAIQRGATFLTVHGDEKIMRAAVRAKGNSSTKIFAITVLTSLDDEALRGMGYLLPAKELVQLKAAKAVECKCDGIIASADDDPDGIRTLVNADHLLIATPGIRPVGAPHQDQKRVATPRQAIASGADYLVVGRPIVEAPETRQAALDIIEEMQLGDGDRQKGYVIP
jgi:orotidine-5'-phosphate decarboxylase